MSRRTKTAGTSANRSSAGWPHVTDDPAGWPPLAEATGDVHGNFEVTTIAEPHYLVIRAHGYRSTRMKVGRVWYLWMPRGRERIDVRLEPQPE